MPKKKTVTKTAKTTKTAKATKATKARRLQKTKKVAAPQKQSTISNVVEYLKLGESYTSLVLGIIAVIIGTVLLLSVFHNRQGLRITPEVTPTVAQSESFAISPQPEASGASPKTPALIKEPTTPRMPQTVTPAPVEVKAGSKSYTVQVGDSLWSISEKVYGSGYNWVDIARANDLSNPDDIHVGNKLATPDVRLPDATVMTGDENLSRSQQESIKAETYTVAPGDSLWGIALRSYGDGYQWVKIAKANNLSDPDHIHIGNVLKIPRG
jgi:nucleoid-associated protein YgaU